SPCVSVAKHTNIRSFPTRRSSDLSVIGAILAFGLGVGVLLLWLYDGRASNKFGILVGQIVAIDSTDLVTFLVASGVVLLVLAVRSEEHTSELQSRFDLIWWLLLVI